MEPSNCYHDILHALLVKIKKVLIEYLKAVHIGANPVSPGRLWKNGKVCTSSVFEVVRSPKVVASDLMKIPGNPHLH